MQNNYELELKNARKTGMGICVTFQEKENFKMAINNYDCPHCGAYFGSKVKFHDSGEIIGHNYEVPSDLEFMHSNVGYSWTEDCKCNNCGEMYSQNNGC